eukprot:1000565-Rhodomonas_salina.3
MVLPGTVWMRLVPDKGTKVLYAAMRTELGFSAICLWPCYEMSGTCTAYEPIVLNGTDSAYVMSGTKLHIAAMLLLRHVRYNRPYDATHCPAIHDVQYYKSVCYAMSGTDLAHAATRRHSIVRSAYATSGTDTPCKTMFLCTCYAMFGTETVYNAVCLPTCYAMSGTDL